ncbi:MAG: hypothetical protein LBC02_13830 [Planctomycetaceae bacterium]|jgi:hypothetical protein|nr:hypothetical protein [Planctomycetaceae bacterium]
MATTEIKELLCDENIYILTPEEEQMIDEAEAELDAGLGISYEVFKQETREWLNHLKEVYG